MYPIVTFSWVKDRSAVLMMFAVHGWSVPSETPKTQTHELSSLASKPSLRSTEVISKAGKKRKRSNGASKTPEVNAANFSELWETIIEKKTNPRDLSKTKDRTKKRPRFKDELDGRSPIVLGVATGDKGDFKAQENDGKWASMVSLKSSDDFASSCATQSETSLAVESIPNLTPLQQSMRQKLISSRFRHLNQTLYTNPSSHSLALFKGNPELFQEYHEGFRRQVVIWPENPLDGYIAQIKRRGMEHNGSGIKSKDYAKNRETKQDAEALPLPRTDRICSIADLGCGDAGLSKGLEYVKKTLKLQIFSYDLQSPNPFVTQADIADLPLRDGSIDVAILCLALMGTNWIDFIEEAFRILRWKGELWIAEIKSRLGQVREQTKRVDHSVGNRKRSRYLKARENGTEANDADVLAEVDNKGATDVSAFVEVLRKRGFILQNDKAVDLSNKMFVRMNFVKGQTPIKGKCAPISKGMVHMWKKSPKGRYLDEGESETSSESTVLKPCVYKLR